jgi:NADH-quinone oxidoreductase subunit N
MEFEIRSLSAVLPEIFLVLCSIVLLMIGVFRGNKFTKSNTVLSMLGLLLFTYLLFNINVFDHSYAFNNQFVTNKFISFIKLVLALATIVILILNMGLLRDKEQPFEFPIIILFSLLGMFIMLSANDFITLYLGLELQSLCLYVLAAFNRDNVKSSEAGLKYFILGSLASGILLYGVSLIYGFSGTTSFGQLAQYLMEHESKVETLPLGLMVGAMMVSIGFLFKVASVPFHVWAPDVYQGSPTIITSFFAVVPKIAAIAFIIRLFAGPFNVFMPYIDNIIILVAVLSMLVGAFGAIKQSNIKRLLAYSSIGHVGLILAGMLSLNPDGVKAITIYLVIYAFMSIGLFACVMLIEKENEKSLDIKYLSGFAAEHPVIAIFISVFLFSMTGIPPLAGFFAKFYIFKALIQSKFYVLAAIGVIASVISAYYYLRIVKIMYLDEPKDVVNISKSKSILSISCFAAIINLVFFLSPSIVIEYISLISKNLLP